MRGLTIQELLNYCGEMGFTKYIFSSFRDENDSCHVKFTAEYSSIDRILGEPTIIFRNTMCNSTAMFTSISEINIDNNFDGVGSAIYLTCNTGLSRCTKETYILYAK